MTRRHLMSLTVAFMLADFVGAAAVFVLVSLLRFEADPGAVWSVGIDVLPASFIFAFTWVTVFFVLGLYRPRARWGLVAETRDVVRGTLVVLAVTLSMLFLLHQDDVSRLFLALLFIAQPGASLVGRAVLRAWFEVQRRRGDDMINMVIAGSGPLAQAFADRVEEHRALGIRVVGHLSVPGEETYRTLSRPVVGSVDQLNRIFQEHVIDEVGVCLSGDATGYLDAIVTVAADEGKTVRVPRDAQEGVMAGAMQEEFDGFLVQSVMHDGQRDLERVVKRLIDIVGAACVLVLFSPLMVFTAVLIRVRDGSPILFRQTRVGLHGRPFTMYKFRTMARDAEDRLPELMARNEVYGPAFKIKDDPRATRLGRRLRRWSIDELPQLINVLRGDMSLVGPRPALPHEVTEYEIWHRRRLSVRPGMTGLWQVLAPRERQFDDRAALDLRYIDHWSLWMDFAILVRTLPAVLGQRGH